MTTISFQCYACHQVLKVGADKAGKRGKCPKCGTALTIPVASADGSAAPPPMMPGPHTTPMPQQHYPQEQYPQQQYPQPTYDPMQQGYQPPQPPGPIRAEIVEDPPVYGAPVYGAPAYEGDYDDGGGVQVRSSPWAMPRVGLLIVFIAFCVVAGAFALQFIGYVISSIQLISVLTSSRVGGGDTDIIFYRIGELLTLLAGLGAVAGYVFCMLGPKQRGMLGLLIACTAVAGLALILGIVFRTIPLFSASPFRRDISPFLPWFMNVLVQVMFAAELVLMTFYLKSAMAVSRPRRPPGVTGTMILAFVYGGLRIISWILFYVFFQARSEGMAKAMGWMFLLFLWAGTVVFIIFLINYLRLLWRVRSIVK